MRTRQGVTTGPRSPAQQRTAPALRETTPNRRTTGFNGADAFQTHRQRGETAPIASEAKATTGSPLIAVRASTVFSKPPSELGAMLKDEVGKATEFVSELVEGLTFFGGARVKETDTVFAQGQAWGEGMLLANLTRANPSLGIRAMASGAFSTEACVAAKASAFALASGQHGGVAVGQMLAAMGGASSPEAMSAALARLQMGAIDASDATLLAGLGTRPRTGAGPGMMHAVPLGYVSARDKLVAMFGPEAQQAVEDFAAQGSRMAGKLPFEQKASDAIERMGYFKHFISRRLALTEGAAGFVIFPGGIGTLNELFEVMRMDRPVLFDGVDFWSGITDAMVDSWKARGMVAADELDCFGVSDGVQAGLPYLLENATGERPNAKTLGKQAAVLGAELERGLENLAKLPPAVTFLGGRNLRADDAEIGQAQALAASLTESGIATRIGGDGALLDAVHAGVRSKDADAPLQGLLYDQGQLDTAAVAKKADVSEVVHSAITHKLLMYENTDAVVALPGGKGTFDEVFEVLCLMSTGNLPQRPLILVGSEFWSPIIDACRAAMDNDDMRLVGEGYFEKFLTIVDTADEARALIDAHRSE